MRARLGATLLANEHCCIATIRKGDERRKRSCVPALTKQMAVYFEPDTNLSLLLLVPRN